MTRWRSSLPLEDAPARTRTLLYRSIVCRGHISAGIYYNLRDMPRFLSLGEARRIALAAQGFDRPRPRGRVDARQIRRTIRQLGLLQIDYVNVLVPAHYQVLFSRLGAFPRRTLDELVYRRREFTEQWAHEASIVPVESWPLLQHRRDAHRVRPWGFEKLLQKHAHYVAWVLQEIETRGPLGADDLPEPVDSPRHLRNEWGWSRSVRRQILEAHFGRGHVAVADRKRNFARTYDLASRVIPPPHFTREMSREQAQRELLLLAARSHGVATASDLADYYRMPVKEARPRLDELVSADALEEVQIETWKQPGYRHPQARLPRAITAAALLSPFDPVVWCRPRVARLFEFDYRVEIFIPPPQRRWGYYVLPFLLGDRLVGRVDLKAERKLRRLDVKAAHIETGARPDVVAAALANELRTLATWLELDRVRVARRGKLSGPLTEELRR